MARPSKLTPETQQKIVQALSVGSTYKIAAEFAGVSYNTFNEWMKSGERAKSGKFREFYEAIKKAEGLAAVKWLSVIDRAATDGTWQAAAWKLERRYGSDYGKSRVEVTTVSWEDEVVELLKSGKVTKEAVIKEVGAEKGGQLALRAGIDG